MYNVSSSPTVTNCSFIGNTASFQGAGMYNENSSPTVTNCSFSGNWASRDDIIHIQGGGMYNFNSSPMVTNCTFSANLASAFDVCNPNLQSTPVAQGGGMYNLNGSPTMTDCSFIGNRASAASRVFPGNNVSAHGGGIYTNGGNLTLTNCTFSGNSTFGTNCGLATPSPGGGVFHGLGGSMTVTSCTFIGNSVFAFESTGVPPAFFLHGGGIATGANTTITDSQFCGNAPDQIHGPYNDGGGNEINMICPPVPDSCPGDLDGDGTVSTSDLLALFANWGPCKK